MKGQDESAVPFLLQREELAEVETRDAATKTLTDTLLTPDYRPPAKLHSVIVSREDQEPVRQTSYALDKAKQNKFFEGDIVLERTKNALILTLNRIGLNGASTLPWAREKPIDLDDPAAFRRALKQKSQKVPPVMQELDSERTLSPDELIDLVQQIFRDAGEFDLAPDQDINPTPDGTIKAKRGGRKSPLAGMKWHQDTYQIRFELAIP